MKNKFKIRTSKMIMWIFIALFIYVIYQGVNYDFSDVTYVDTAIFVACITAVSGILGAIITKYLNNSNCENIPKIQMELYRDSMNLRYEYNKKMMELKKRLEIENDYVYQIEAESHIDEFTDSVLNNAISDLDLKSSQSREDVSIQNY